MYRKRVLSIFLNYLKIMEVSKNAQKISIRDKDKRERSKYRFV